MLYFFVWGEKTYTAEVEIRGKSEFTREEVDEIVDLLSQKENTANQGEQSELRKKIRDIGFYAEDHGIRKGEYTVENFLKAILRFKKPQQVEFWHLQMSKGLTDDRELTTVDVLEILQNEQIIGTGEWKDNRADQCMRFKEHLKVGDIVMVRNGGTPIGLVQVVGENVQWDIYENQRDVRILSFFDNIIESSIGTYTGQTRGTLERVANRNTPTGSFIVNWYNRIVNEMEHSELIDLLKQKHQIILQGPPGTGKTYTAKDLSEKLIFGSVSLKENQKQRLASTDQFRMIQFHPAYSYEDFVRGIEAKAKSNQVEYLTVNRVLTELAGKALRNYEDSQKGSKELTEEKWLDDTFSEFTEYIQDKIDGQEGKMILDGTTTYLKIVEEDCFRYTGDKWGYEAGNRMMFQDIKEMYRQNIKSRQEIKKMSGVSGLAIQHASYFMKVLNLFYRFLDEKDTPKVEQPSVTERPYVLIIDEINRANLPSVLGELIYALEYRGEAVDSMYEKDGEGRKITLPPNLYIIGTMNTADRSIGHIDYAIRRRFAFVDVLPNPEPIREFALPKFEAVSKLFIKNYDAYVSGASDTLERADSLSSDFRPEEVWIGHSYFITKADGDEGKKELSLKMKYEVIPLLKEYIKDGILTEEAEEAVYQL